MLPDLTRGAGCSWAQPTPPSPTFLNIGMKKIVISEEKIQDVVRMLVDTDFTIAQIGAELGTKRGTTRNYISLAYSKYGLEGEMSKRHILVRRFYELGTPNPGGDQLDE